MARLNIPLLLTIIATASVTLQLKSCFTPVRKPEEMVRNEERIKYLEADRRKDSVELVDTREKYDSLIFISLLKVSSFEIQKQPIRYAIKQVPVIVSNLDKEQLRTGATNY